MLRVKVEYKLALLKNNLVLHYLLEYDTTVFPLHFFGLCVHTRAVSFRIIFLILMKFTKYQFS